jgi:hypothetical protein
VSQSNAVSKVKMTEVDVVLDLVSRYLAHDPCVNQENSSTNCFKLKDYLKLVTTELKSAQQIIRILHEDRINTTNPNNQYNLSNQIYKDAGAIKTTKLRSNNVSYKNEKLGKKKQKIVIMGDSHARDLV